MRSSSAYLLGLLGEDLKKKRKSLGILEGEEGRLFAVLVSFGLLSMYQRAYACDLGPLGSCKQRCRSLGLEMRYW